MSCYELEALSGAGTIVPRCERTTENQITNSIAIAAIIMPTLLFNSTQYCASGNYGDGDT